MKTCPHCKRALNFIQFVTGYGSDTLFKHPVQGHPREHRCLHCHRVLWIHYDVAFFKRRLRQTLPLYFVFSAVMTFVGVKPALHFSNLQAVLFMVLALLFGGVILKTFARYESAVFKEEKASVC